MKSDNAPKKLDWFAWACLLVLLALCLTHVDALRAIRDEEWPGFDAQEVNSLFLVVVLYAAFIAVFSGALSILARLLRLKGVAGSRLLLSVLAACVVWTMTAYATPTLSALYWTLGYAGVLATGAAVAVGAWAGISRRLGLLLVIVGAAGLLVHLEASALAIALPSRRLAGHAALLAWLFPAAVFLLVLLLVKRRERMIFGLLFVAWLVAPFAAAFVWTWWGARTQPARPNIVLITAETLRADACAPFAPDAPTPAMAALSARGTWFSRSYSAAPWTIPSLVALMSSQYAATLTETTSLSESTSLPQAIRYAAMPEHETLAETLQQAGYVTAGYRANPLLGMLRSTTDGFQYTRLYDFLTPDQSSVLPQSPLMLCLLTHLGYDPPVPPIDTTARLTLLAKSYLRWQSLSPEPFFLWLHFGDCHAPYTPPPAFCENPALAREMANLTRETWPPMPIGARYFEEMSPEEQQRLRALYDAEVRYVDAALGELCGLMDALGLFDTSVICFSSDHGEEFWEHGCWGHGCTLYEPGIRVPLILCAPQIARTGEQGVLFSGYDLAPTLVALAGVEPPAPWQGRDFSLWLTGGNEPGEAGSCFVQGTLPFTEIPLQRALVEGDDKVIRWPNEPRVERYDLSRNPGETENLAVDSPTERQETLVDELQRHAEQAPTPPEMEDAGTAEDFNQQLRAIGYL